ncbi:hypothetical protein NEUTE1DRAFT_43920, partial [Neurospora tetrasperma FGSC 2508]
INPVRIVFSFSGSTITPTRVISGSSSTIISARTVSGFGSSGIAPSNPMAFSTPSRPVINKD